MMARAADIKARTRRFPAKTRPAETVLTVAIPAAAIALAAALLVLRRAAAAAPVCDSEASFSLAETAPGAKDAVLSSSRPPWRDSAIVSARNGQHEFVLGNIIGSNFFNTLAVVGLSGAISPFKDVSPYIFSRDLPAMAVLTLSIAAFGLNFRNPRTAGRLTRKCGVFYIAAFLAYIALLLRQELVGA